MFSNRLAFAALAVGCMAAAAGGGYLATRQNTVPTPAAAAAPTAAPTPDSTAQAPARPVQETEAVVGDSRPSSAAPAAEPPATKRVDAPRSQERRASASQRSARATQGPPPLDRTWPSGAAAPAPLPSAPVPAAPSAAPADDRQAQEGQRALDPP